MKDGIAGLEGMRGLAAFWVYTHHFLLIFFPRFFYGPHSWPNHVFSADLAISWFFVHSGLVLAWKTRKLEGREYKLTLVDQSLRRYLRLLPPVLVSTLLIYFILKLGLNFNEQYAREINSQWLSLYLRFRPDFLEALYQAFFGVYFDFRTATTYNPPLWMIGHELISSYILFAMLGLFGQGSNSVWIFALLGLVITPWKGLMCFMLGAAMARMPIHRTPYFYLGIFAFFGFAISDFPGRQGEYLRSIGAAMLMYVLLQAPHLRRLLAWKWFRRLGEVSYSLYVLHFAILISLTSYFGLKWQAHESLLLVLALYLVTTVALLFLSYLMWRFVDRPGILDYPVTSCGQTSIQGVCLKFERPGSDRFQWSRPYHPLRHEERRYKGPRHIWYLPGTEWMDEIN